MTGAGSSISGIGHRAEQTNLADFRLANHVQMSQGIGAFEKIPMYRIRLFLLIIQCLFGRERSFAAHRTLTFRAMPLFDTDVTKMFTHGYGRFMELGLWNLLLSSDLRKIAFKKKLAPTTSNEIFSYKKSIKAFQKLELTTQLVHWDDRTFYLEHIIRSEDGTVCATAIVTGVMRSPGGVVRPADIIREAGLMVEPGALSASTSNAILALQGMDVQLPQRLAA